MTRVPYEERKRAADMLFKSERPLQIIQDQQFPGLAARRKETELANSTTVERALAFFARLGQATGMC